MRLSEHQQGIEWLRQFARKDVHAARFALDSLKLVSFSEFEASIIRSLRLVIERVEGKVAAFTLDKKIIDPSSKPGSEDRLAHLLTGLTRVFGDQVLINPSDDSMAEEKVSDVILVDDFVASGSRILDFWRAWEPKRLKSWISLGYCKLWLVGHAIHRKGISAASGLKGLAPERMIFDVTLEGERDYWPASLIKFFEKTVELTFHEPFSANFGGIQSPIVFQHGCPDNAPALFCRNGLGFKALFPNRSIPIELYPCFDRYTDSYRTPDLLWDAGQPTLALQALDAIADGTNDFQSDILEVLGILAKGLSPDKLSSVMTASSQAVSDRIGRCMDLGLLDGESNITPFGLDLLARARRQYLSQRQFTAEPDSDSIYYVPKQFSGKFCGVQ
jgi:hypothetical protein